jgi:hypothetical protein
MSDQSTSPLPTISQPTIFLGINGVLNGHQWIHRGGPQITPDCVVSMNALLVKSNALVVLTSTWRQRVHGGSITVAGLQWLLRTHGLNITVQDVLPSGEVDTRAAQITSYLAGRPEIKQYVVLDHRKLDVPNLVQTDPAKGIQPWQITEALQVLGVIAKPEAVPKK